VDDKSYIFSKVTNEYHISYPYKRNGLFKFCDHDVWRLGTNMSDTPSKNYVVGNTKKLFITTTGSAYQRFHSIGPSQSNVEQQSYKRKIRYT
jgi:hypothetical protein